MLKKIDILDVKVDNVVLNDVIDVIKKSIKEKKFCNIVSINALTGIQAKRDKEFKKIMNTANLVLADGMGIILASKLLGKSLKERIAGIDLIPRLCKFSEENGSSIFFFGSLPGIVEDAILKLKQKFPKMNVSGVQNGYFDKNMEGEIINRINSSATDILLVGLGQPRQEKWIYNNRDKINSVCIGVGGSFDVISGRVSRAPKILQELGLEWLYRLILQPYRFKRILWLPYFIWLVLVEFLNAKWKSKNVKLM
ncbi:MAG: WecB/TagA/CpsF family glycosyltransferase [Candidatus Firestonebacteria bacterium]